MIISPPFLPTQGANQSEDAWLDSAMTPPASRLANTKAPEGSFPLSYNLLWHTGMHLQGVASAGSHVVVRAIADGEVIFVAPPRQPNNDAADPQNFNSFGNTATWTDNGCVILRHTTEIGSNGQQATTITYYSLYMHLNWIGRITPSGQTAARRLQVGDRIWRKDEVGRAGQIYGHGGQVHLEVCLDEANLTHLIGRAPAWVDPAHIPAPTADGRSDAVFGAIWFYLPANTPTAATQPASHLRAPGQTTLGQALWVRMHYAQGGCRFESYDTTGTRTGAIPLQAEVEYDLYTEAKRRHRALSSADQAHSSPSGWYELLRFGRNLGRGPAPADKDPLPAKAAHWRLIPGPDSRPVWADLNAEGSYKFSDADFLPIQGWCFINDDTSPQDQRCDSTHLKQLIADSGKDKDPLPANLDLDQLASRLGDSEVAGKMKRTVCNFPSEWDQTTIAIRYAFVQQLEPFQQDPASWPVQEAHLKAVSFPDLPAEYLQATWRFQPREFIGVMRKCGWLSLNEFAQSLPKYSYFPQTGNIRIFQTTHAISLLVASSRFAVHNLGLNLCIRKYSLEPKTRLIHFLAQTFIETDRWKVVSEYGSGKPVPEIPMIQYYSAFHGRGIMQLTWAGNYEAYGVFRAIPDNTSGTYGDPRITAASTHYWGDPTIRNAKGQIIGVDPNKPPRRWSPRFDPTIIKNISFNASDSGGFYWIWKDVGNRKKNINRICDRGVEPSVTDRVSKLVNGGAFGYFERQAYVAYLTRYLSDTTEDAETKTVLTPRANTSVTVNFSKPD